MIYDECTGCNQEIDPTVDHVFITIDDKAFHRECWNAWLDSNEGLEVY